MATRTTARLRRPGQLVAGPVARLAGIFGPDTTGIVETMGALVLALIGSLVAGLTLGSITATLEGQPGLLVLVPAAIALRGAIFGTLGSRLATAIHMGQFQLSWRADTVVGQNVLAVALLSLVASVVLGVLAKAVAVAFGVVGTISLADFVVISALAGILSALVMAAFTMAIASFGTHRGWDLDNVTSPLVTGVSDMVTLPALWLTSHAGGVEVVTPALAGALTLATVVSLMLTVRSRLVVVRRIVRESVPVLAGAGLVSLVAGITLEKQLHRLESLPALLVLVPPFLSSGGALGSILASRLSSKLHLGSVTPKGVPDRGARRDLRQLFVLGLPLFVLVAAAVHQTALVADLASPGFADLVAVALLAAAIALAVAMVVAYYGSVLAFRLGFDPDNYGIPLVTSTMDLVGAFSLVVAVASLGVA